MAHFRGTLIRAGNNAKTTKGDGEFATAIMYLAPATSLEGINVCPMAEAAGCTKACLFTAGRGRMSNVQEARLNKTRRYRDDRAAFMAELVADLERFQRWCSKRGVKPAVRLNGTSDIQWEVGHPCKRTKRDTFGFADGEREFASIMEAFPNVQFYDYTKIAKRVYRDLPANYHLTLSYSMASKAYAGMILKAARETGANVAVVFRNKAEVAHLVGRNLFLANDWNAESVDRMVFNGDDTDLRFTDPKGVIVALYAKGEAKRDKTGFVID